MADPRLKTIKIKTGVVKRVAKEKVVYEREVEEQREKIQKLKQEGKDEYDIRKQEEVLQECLMMIPECKRRLAKAFEDLENIINNEQDLVETEEYTNAKSILNDAKVHLPVPGEELHLC